MDILKEAPAWVKYKDDLYGPLGLILFGVQARKRIIHDISVPTTLPPLPEEKLLACKIFGEEWKQRRFTKKELAETIERILEETE